MSRYKIITPTRKIPAVYELEKEMLMEIKDKPILDSGERTTFNTGAVRDCKKGVGRFDLLPMRAIWRLAKHFEKGAEKYDERNWEKGIPMHSLMDSALRHLVKYIMGWKDEDHLVAAAWNVMCALEMEEIHPELMDLPFQKMPERACTETDCFYNDYNCQCECDNEGFDPAKGKNCRWYSED